MCARGDGREEELLREEQRIERTLLLMRRMSRNCMGPAAGEEPSVGQLRQPSGGCMKEREFLPSVYPLLSGAWRVRADQ